MISNVKIYMSPECPFCKKTKDILSENKIDFVAVDVTSDKEALKEMIELSGARSVPVINMCGQILVGFDSDKLKQMINCMKQRTEI